MTASLLAYYPMDEGSGTALLDASGNGFDGSWVGTPTWSTSKPGAIGFTDTHSAYFDGTSYVTLPNLGISGNVPFSMCAWINKSSYGSPIGDIFSFGTSAFSGDMEFSLDYPSSGDAVIFYQNTQYLHTATGIGLGAWHHLCFVSDGSNVFLYVDGTLVASSATAFTMNNVNYRIGVSGPQPNLYKFNGYMDDLRVYLGALTSAQVLAIATGTFDPTGSTIVTRGSCSQILLQSSTQQNLIIGPMVLASDSKSPAIGKTLTVKLSKNGGAFAAAAGTPGSIGGGMYYLSANATDNNTLGPLVLNATAPGCDQRNETYQVIAADFQSASSGYLNVCAQQIADGQIKRSTFETTGVQLVSKHNMVVSGTSTPSMVGSAYQSTTLEWNGQFVWTLSAGGCIWLDLSNSCWVMSNAGPGSYGTSSWVTPISTGDETGPYAPHINATGSPIVVCLDLPSSGKNFAKLTVDGSGNVQTSAGSGDFNSAQKTSLQAALTNQGLTTTRAGYLDTLNIGGPVASHADVLAIKAKTDLIGTNAMDSANAVTAQGNAVTAVSQTAASAIAAAVWNALISSITTTNSIGVRLLNFVGSLVYSTPITPPSAITIASAILTDPANKVTTNSDGSVNSNVTEWLGHAVTADSNNIPVTSLSSLAPITITIPPAVAVGSLLPSQITCVRGDTLRVALPLMGDLSTRTKMVMTAKMSTTDSDAQAVFQIVEGIGLTRLNGSVPASPNAASLTVTNASTGTVTLEIDASVTAVLAVQDLDWDVQAYLSSGISTPICGAFSISADVTRSVN